MPKFKVMTWNVENLFQLGAVGGPKTEAEYRQKLSSLAEVILNLAPDVLALQEIGSAEALSDLGELLAGKYPHRQLSANPDGRGIRVGFLSTLKIEEREEIIDFPAVGLPSVPGIDARANLDSVTRLSRGALRILVKPATNLPIHLITAHLKSKLLSFPTASGSSRFNPKDENERARVAGIALLKRTAEAVALRVMANERLQGNRQEALVLLGDLNDVTDAATTQILNGPGGSEVGTAGFDRPDEGDDTRLFNLASLIPLERRFSRVNQGNKELIDHILVSQELLPGKPRRLPVVDSHIDAFGTLPSVGNNPAARSGEPASDHAPITAAFEF
ncbi:endonuclease/exonuclease/phosphatase family protein [Altericista sp. CCNU0014]|uniref:endonuclease/exonuclease/phosphatase family protein n=1 Tax=Altericista sp. CCNU0014 TaxID=3082949 RepID=UPI00384C2384